MAVVSALTVANKFIDVANRKGDVCSNMKLQKLVYFAHGLHLAFDQGPLVREPFEAWKYGPVVPDLYHKFKNYFAGPVPINHPYRHAGEVLSPFAAALIERTYETFGKYSAVRLSELSHGQNSPWSEAYNAAGGALIDNSRVEKYFKNRFLKKSAVPA